MVEQIPDSIEITAVWLTIDPDSVGSHVTVLVELPDGMWREVIAEVYPGPCSHTAYPAKIRKAAPRNAD